MYAYEVSKINYEILSALQSEKQTQNKPSKDKAETKIKKAGFKMGHQAVF